MKKLAVLLLFILLTGSFSVSLHAEEGESVLGKRYTEGFLSGALDPLWNSFSPALQQVFGSFAGFKEFYTQIVITWEAESELVQEEEMVYDNWLVYQGVRYFPRAQVHVVFEWAYNADGLIVGLQVFELPQEAPTKFVDYQTKTDLRLPFDQEWYVFWGGRTLAQNYHAANVSQRFAYDFVVLEGGRTYRNDGVQNQDYYAFGLPILAPGAGIVLEVCDDIPDNNPGTMNPDQPLGNYVIIDHQNGEYSFLAHFQQGSVIVSQGDYVSQGDLLGLCGNSGNSSEAHLHYHLQNTPLFLEGEGLPAQFMFYSVDGTFLQRGEPVQGNLVQHMGRVN
ncbi:MAG: M23 family metallopeptidase [Firmicutes bacterium]|nr:M23 family metallopeptidase [Bacillota bacterium]